MTVLTGTVIEKQAESLENAYLFAGPTRTLRSSEHEQL
jgi:hypothetical protein